MRGNKKEKNMVGEEKERREEGKRICERRKKKGLVVCGVWVLV